MVWGETEPYQAWDVALSLSLSLAELSWINAAAQLININLDQTLMLRSEEN